MMTGEKLKTLDTPCIILDMAKVRRNIESMQKSASSCGCALRPHIKTHKSVEIARIQIAAGASGITCAKTSEAEVFADGGIEDIFVAYPLIGEIKLQRALKLQKKLRRLIVAVDSFEGAKVLSDFAVRENITFETRLEVDTGAGRTGANRGALKELGAVLRALPGIHVTGVYTFKSLVLNGAPTNDAEAAGADEGRLMAEAAAFLREAGLDIRDISAGSTPTGPAVAATGLVNEIRPGTYVFNDWMTEREGACREEDIAAFVCATVVSTPSPYLAVLDAGTKTFSADIRLNSPPLNLPGFAKAVGRPELVLDRLNEEHGMLHAADGGATGLTAGDVLMLIPSHICTAVNLQDALHMWDGEDLQTLRVDARGCVR